MLSLILIVYMITTSGIKIHIKKDVTNEQIYPTYESVDFNEDVDHDLEKLKEDPVIKVYEDALSSTHKKITEILEGNDE